jgi:hypothetical protein
MAKVDIRDLDRYDEEPQRKTKFRKKRSFDTDDDYISRNVSGRTKR